jgi:hypothetical protein
MRKLFGYLLVLQLLLFIVSCGDSQKSNSNGFSFENPEDTSTRILERYKYYIDTPVCTDEGCSGVYKGVEFVDVEYMQKLKLTGTDIAHNYSNVMARYVGDKLKELYNKIISEVEVGSVLIENKNAGLGLHGVLTDLEGIQKIELDDIVVFKKL